MPRVPAVSNAFAMYQPSLTSTDNQVKLSAVDKTLVVKMRVSEDVEDGVIVEFDLNTSRG